MSFTIGSTVGSYEIVEKLGRGGMATVYKGRHLRLDRYDAIKVLHPMLNDDDSFLRRFYREAKLIAQLKHPHIVPVHDFNEHEGQPYLVMRLVEGDTLKERMMRGPLSKAEILHITQAVGEGLDYAHEQGILHRDIKPSNIMLTANNGVYITDFGLARMTQAVDSTLSQDMIMGTPKYISPEQAMGNQKLDGRTDLYSFGIVLYELVTGQAPFQSETTYSIIHMQIFEPPPPPSSLNGNISTEMEAVLLKALAKEPSDRYDSCDDLIQAFRSAFDTMPEEFAPTGPIVTPQYTPSGTTKVMADAQVSAKPEPAQESVEHAATAVSPLPTLVTDAAQTTGVEEIGTESMAATAVVPAKKQRPTWMIVGITAVVVLLLGGLAYGLSDLFEGEDEHPPALTDNPPPGQNPEQPVENPPPREPENEPPDENNEPGSANKPIIIVQQYENRPIEDIEAELAENPDEPQLKAELAAALLREGNLEEARDIVGDLFSRIRQPHQFINTTDRMMESENYELAYLILEEGLSRFRNDPELQHRFLMVLILTNAQPKAIEEFADFVAENMSPPTEVNLDIAEAYLAFAYGDPEEALGILEDLTEEEDHFLASTYFLIGQLHIEMYNSEAANEAFERALEHEPFPWLNIQIEKRFEP